MKKILLGLTFILASSVYAFQVQNFTVAPEVGASLGWNNFHNVKDPNYIAYGGYGRVWLGGERFLVAPQVKYDFIGIKPIAYRNLQVSGLLGVRFGAVTFYGGAGWSDIYGGFNDAAVVNYGVKFDTQVAFLTLGIDGSYQRPRITGTNNNISINRIAFTLGFTF